MEFCEEEINARLVFFYLLSLPLLLGKRKKRRRSIWPFFMKSYIDKKESKKEEKIDTYRGGG